MIKINGLNKYYNNGKNHVLKDINLTFEDTGLVCILGESGCGKTTLLNTIGGLDDFSSGSVDINEDHIKKYSLSESEKVRNKNFGFVFQNYYLLKDYTVYYNIRLALNIYDLTDEEKDARVNYVLDALHISKYRKKLVSQLSGGQQQRVSIARALVKSPRIILADEPTGNLDEENTIRTMSILRAISKECLVIVVTHERDIADFFADRIIKIKDGVIVKDKKNSKSGTYVRKSDTNIYLREMEEADTSLEELHFKLYHESSESEDDGVDYPDITLRFAWREGKLYIQNESDTDVVLTDDDSDIHLVNEKRPELDIRDTEKIDYNLDRLDSISKGRFRFREILALALENIKLIGKKQIFIIVIMIITSVLLTMGTVNYMDRINVDRRQIVKDDSHIVNVKFKTTGKGTETEVNSAVQKILDEVIKDKDYDYMFPDQKTVMSLHYTGFTQLSKVDRNINGISLVKSSVLKKSQIVLGRLPENEYEIVIDEWAIYKLQQGKNILSQLLTSDRSFINQQITDTSSNVSYTIVGVSRTYEPDIYIGEEAVANIGNFNTHTLPLSLARKIYGGEFDSVKLSDSDAVVSRADYDAFRQDGLVKEVWNDQAKASVSIGSGEYNVKYKSDTDLRGTVVLSDKEYNENKYSGYIQNRAFNIYTKDSESAIKNIRHLGSNYSGIVKVQASNLYQAELDRYKRKALPDVNYTTFLTAGVFLVSLFMIYFMIKSNAMSRIEELTVYRLIGISRGSILKTYMLEISIMTVCTSLPSILITAGIIKFISSVPSLEISLTFPWWSVLLLFLVITAVNNLISILPVRRILSKPPAQLAARE